MKTSLVLMMVAAMCVGAAADEAKVVPATKALPAGWVTPQQKEAEQKARELKAEQEKKDFDRVMAALAKRDAENVKQREQERAQAANPAPVVSYVTTPVQTPAMDSMSERQKHDRKTAELLERQNARLQAEALERIANELELRRLQGR